jgi:uracil-DNA glycosylase
MAERLSNSLKNKIEDRLRYHEDLGISLFYRERGPLPDISGMLPARPIEIADSITTAESAIPYEMAAPSEENSLPKPTPKPAATGNVISITSELLGRTAEASLFESISKVPGDSLLKIREDIGECTRCKLHKTRNKIVFGDGNPKAQLVFIGEGPGADEDKQGLPFVGRAGKLLTQMIEAMGLQRPDVYICNVVKCRPPENRAPEPDEVATCSPFLLRQLDAIAPKVIVCLGATAAKTLLETVRGISQLRGQWLEWRGHKLMVTYHPAYLLRNPAAKGEVWKDLQKVMAELGLQVSKKSKST